MISRICFDWNWSVFVLIGLSGWSWWLLAPNTPRQDHRPCTLRRNFKFRLTPFPAPAGQRANPWFALCTPDSFSAAQRGVAKKDEGVQGENLWLTPWSTGVETIMEAKNLIFCDGCRARGPAEECWGREATNSPAITDNPDSNRRK